MTVQACSLEPLNILVPYGQQSIEEESETTTSEKVESAVLESLSTENRSEPLVARERRILIVRERKTLCDYCVFGSMSILLGSITSSLVGITASVTMYYVSSYLSDDNDLFLGYLILMPIYAALGGSISGVILSTTKPIWSVICSAMLDEELTFDEVKCEDQMIVKKTISKTILSSLVGAVAGTILGTILAGTSFLLKPIIHIEVEGYGLAAYPELLLKTFIMFLTALLITTTISCFSHFLLSVMNRDNKPDLCFKDLSFSKIVCSMLSVVCEPSAPTLCVLAMGACIINPIVLYLLLWFANYDITNIVYIYIGVCSSLAGAVLGVSSARVVDILAEPCFSKIEANRVIAQENSSEDSVDSNDIKSSESDSE